MRVPGDPAARGLWFHLLSFACFRRVRSYVDRHRQHTRAWYSLEKCTRTQYIDYIALLWAACQDHVYTYIYIYIYMYIQREREIEMYLYVIYIYIYTYEYIHIHTYVYAHACVYIYIYILHLSCYRQHPPLDGRKRSMSTKRACTTSEIKETYNFSG